MGNMYKIDRAKTRVVQQKEKGCKMMLVNNLSKYDWTTWVVGIWRAVISGGSNGVLSGLVSMGVDPQHFNLADGLTHTLKMMTGMFVLSGIVALFLFLSTHAAPEVEK